MGRSIVEEVVQHNALAGAALHALDIRPEDQDKLANFLDPDHSGTIDVLACVNGLRRLRGTPLRSDTISVELVAQATQEKVEEILSWVRENAAAAEVDDCDPEKDIISC